jgi:hypothetical protein
MKTATLVLNGVAIKIANEEMMSVTHSGNHMDA